MTENKYPHLFTPFTIRHIRFKNRILGAPQNAPTFWNLGYPSEAGLALFDSKASGGCASLTVPETYVDNHYKRMLWGLELTYKDAVNGINRISKVIKRHGAVAVIELNHLGEDSVPENSGGWAPAGPSPRIREDGVEIVRMDEDMMNVAADAFADSARLCQIGGMDMVMIHAGHGWLIHKFMSPEFNTRTDEYGGSAENRARFPAMVLDRIREKCGDKLLIEFRISGSDRTDQGMKVEDTIEVMQYLKDKIDILHVSTGIHSDESTISYMFPAPFVQTGLNVEDAGKLKKALGIPVTVVGAINTPELAEEIIASGKADFVSIARGLTADPKFPKKARLGLEDEIIPCVRCRDCLSGADEGIFNCAMNPNAGDEAYYRSLPEITEPRKVVVVGGGAAGLKAAITAAERGHKVTLFERGDKLGGHLCFTDNDCLKQELRRVKDALITQVRRRGVEVVLGVEVTPEMVRQMDAYAVIAAVGSDPIVPRLPGIENAVHALDMYNSQKEPGGNIVIIGGNLVGCETGLELAVRGKNVTILEMADDYASDFTMYRANLVEMLEEHSDKISIRTGMKATQVTSGGVVARSKDGTEHTFAADDVVYAVGMRSRGFEQFRDCASFFYPVGDCSSPGKVRQALYDGYMAALDIL